MNQCSIEKQFSYKFTDTSYLDARSYVIKNNIEHTTREYWNIITTSYDDKYLHKLCIKFDTNVNL